MTRRIADPSFQEAVLDPSVTGDPLLRDEGAREAASLLREVSGQPLPSLAEVEAKDGESGFADAGFIKDRTNPGSVISCVPAALREYVQAIPDEVLELGLSELESRVKPTEALIRLRFNFWHEMDRLAARIGPYKASAAAVVSVNEVCVGAGDKAYFMRILKMDPYASAWLFTRPSSYERAIDVAHMAGLARMEQILAQNPVKDGVIDVKVAALQIKVFEMLDLRVKGAPKQTIENKNLNLHGQVPAAAALQPASAAQIADLEREVKALEHKVSLPSGSAVSGFDNEDGT